MLRAAALIATVATSPSAALASPDADKVIRAVQNTYRNTRQLRARFEQRVTNATFGRTTRSSGRLYVKRPGKMRWDYLSKRRAARITKSFLSDGKNLWAVDHQGLQYVRRSAASSALPAATTFLTGTGTLHRDFHAAIAAGSKFGGGGDVVVKLTPKRANARYKTLWLVIDRATSRVTRSVVLNVNGDTDEFRFAGVETGRAIPNRWFVFNPRANPTYRRINP